MTEPSAEVASSKGEDVLDRERVDRDRLLLQTIDRFDRQIHRGESPSIEHVLEGKGPQIRDALLQGLLEIEFEFRIRRGQPIDEDAYVRRFPDARTQVAAARQAVSELLSESNGVPPIPIPSSPSYSIRCDFKTGGRGKLYLAHDHELDREVVLKEIRSADADDPEIRERLRREAIITGRLNHPGVVPVYRLCHYSDGRPYYTMRPIVGQELSKVIQDVHDSGPGRSPAEQRLAFRQLLQSFLSACQTVEYAHRQGILHRDLKPRNIMVGDQGEVVIIDWGMARTIGADPEDQAQSPPASRTPEGPPNDDMTTPISHSILGTPGYISPEQLEGKHSELDGRSDVFSLGTILYFILTGRRAFQAESTGKLIEATRSGRFPSPRVVNPSVCPSLEAICLKAMALDREERYASASQLSDDLRCWLADEPVSVFRAPLITRCLRWIRSHPSLASGTVAATIVGLTALLITVVLITGKNWEIANALAVADRDFSLAAETIKRSVMGMIGGKDAGNYLPNEIRVALATETLSFYQSAVVERQNDLSLKADASHIFRMVGNLHSDAMDELRARKMFQNSWDQATSVRVHDPHNSKYIRNWCHTALDYANFEREIGQGRLAAQTLKEFRDAIDVAALAASDDPDDRRIVPRLNLIEGKLRAEQDEAGLRRAEGLLREAEAQLTSLSSTERLDAIWDLISCRIALAQFLRQSHRAPEAKDLLKRTGGPLRQLSETPAYRGMIRFLEADRDLCETLILADSGAPVAEVMTRFNKAIAFYDGLFRSGEPHRFPIYRASQARRWLAETLIRRGEGPSKALLNQAIQDLSGILPNTSAPRIHGELGLALVLRGMTVDDARVRQEDLLQAEDELAQIIAAFPDGKAFRDAEKRTREMNNAGR